MNPASQRLASRPVLSWALYDLANTIFSYAVVTRYFNDWVINQLHQQDWTVGLMGLIVSLALIVSLPVAGALADELGRRKPLLVAFTLICCTATALLGAVSSAWMALVVCGVALYAYNSAMAHYDPLLDAVARGEQMQGKVSGLGVALGYVGVLIALPIFGALVPEDRLQAAFLPTAVLFLLFALPCFLWVREQHAARVEPRRPVRELRAGALREVAGSARRARSLPYGRFLIARFLYVDAIATVIAFMTVYAGRVGHLHGGQVTVLMALSIIFAILAALAAGRLAPRAGLKRALSYVIVFGAGVLVVAGLSGSAVLLWALGPAVGVVLGAIGTCDRLLMLELASPEQRGEAFGLYALVGKLSSGLGPLILWGGTIWLLHTRLDMLSLAAASRGALLMLAAAALCGVAVLRGVQGGAPPAR